MRKLLLLFLGAISLSLEINAQATCDSQEHQAYGTVYFLLDNAPDGDKSGNCSYINSEIKPYYAALKDVQYATADYCGVCAEVTGPIGTQLVRIVDKCPTCTGDWDLDLSPAAFEAVIGPANQGGHVAITWEEVPCPWSDDNIIVSTEGTNEWYAKLVIYHHTNDITDVEIEVGSTWYPLARTVDNGWVSDGTEGLNASNNPHRVRITDKYGAQVIVENVDLTQPMTLFNGTSNFAPCSPTVGLDELGQNEISLFPNPTNGMLTIGGVQEASRVEIVNALGEVVMQTVVNGAEQQMLNLEGYASGVYMVRLQMNSGALVSKQFVVK